MIKGFGVTALVACASLVFSSCGGSSSDVQAKLPSLDDVLIESQNSGSVSDDEVRILSLECTATDTGSVIETGTVDFTMRSSDYDWSASNVAYSYDSASGTISIEAGQVVNGSGVSVDYSTFVLKISVDSNLIDAVNSDYTSYTYTGYQSASSVEVTGEIYGDGTTYNATATIVGQSVIITKTAN